MKDILKPLTAKLSTRQTFRLSLILIVGTTLVIASFFVPKTALPIPNHQPAAFNLTNSLTYQGLPVGEVKSYQTENSWGTAIFIPQYHKNPGTEAQDKKNDSATTTQEQIYQILGFLTSQAKIKLIMVEGELFGEVPAEKVANLAQRIDRRNQCLSLLNSLKSELDKQSLDSKAEQSLYQKLHSQLVQADRETSLEGAALKLKVTGQNLTLVGSENEQTQKESKVLVRNYLYLEDRLNELEDPNLSKKQLSFKSLDSNYDQLIRLLLDTKSDTTAAEEFIALYQKASSLGKNNLKTLLQETEQAFANLDPQSQADIGSRLGLINSSKDQAPSRDDNPYQHITSQTKLKQLMDQSEQQIDEVVVKRRNQETAQNFAQALKNQKSDIGILLFGAGHEEGLISELQNSGLSVIVIKPQEVGRRN